MRSLPFLGLAALLLFAACGSSPSSEQPVPPASDAGGSSPADAALDHDQQAPDSAHDALADQHLDTATDTAVEAEAEASGPDPCLQDPPAEALVRAGPYQGGLLLPGGRMLTPWGVQLPLGGFPIDMRLHPSLPVAYVTSAGIENRSIFVVDYSVPKIVQEVVRSDSFFGMAITADGTRLFASEGYTGQVDVFDVAPDGTLSAAAQIPVSNYPAGLALSSDGTKLWVGQFRGSTTGSAVVVIDPSTLTVTDTIWTAFGVYNLLEVPKWKTLFGAGYGDSRLVAINLLLGTILGSPSVGGNPMGMVLSSDGNTIYTTSANDDKVVALNPVTQSVIASQAVGEPSIAPPGGDPYPASSPTGIALDSGTNRLYVARSADNAVSVFDAETLLPLGAIPVGWYPTTVSITPGGKLLVANGKGIGAGPLVEAPLDGKAAMTGTLSIVDLSTADIVAGAQQVEDNVRRPSQVYPFSCDKPFPIPVHAGDQTPIQHIILLTRENKTYDALLGDLDRGERDPQFVLYGEQYTPNLHSLARQFTLLDNFYDDSDTSMQGHLWLTSSFVNDYIERNWFEVDRGNDDFQQDAAIGPGRPSFQSFFIHLINNNISFRIFGQVVGSLDTIGTSQAVMPHVDLTFPGQFFDLTVKDEEKANHVISQLIDVDFPQFSYVLLPDDHTNGLSAGSLSPGSMVNDNDYATGLLVDKISHSKYWDSTAIFIVEDDPQQGGDHVDYHRSMCVIASPWSRAGFVSSVHTSIPSLFRTFELMLGIPPMNRYDALATPMWNAFSTTSTPGTYSVIPRTIPDTMNPDATLGAAISARMDFRGPDRNPDLGDLLLWHHKGIVRPGSRIQRALAGDLTVIRPEHDDDD